MTNDKNYKEKIFEVNDSLNRLKQNDDFKKFLDFYTTEHRNYIASMLSTESFNEIDFNKVVSGLKSISDFESYIDKIPEIVDDIKNSNKETYDPNAGVL